MKQPRGNSAAQENALHPLLLSYKTPFHRGTQGCNCANGGEMSDGSAKSAVMSTGANRLMHPLPAPLKYARGAWLKPLYLSD